MRLSPFICFRGTEEASFQQITHGQDVEVADSVGFICLNKPGRRKRPEPWIAGRNPSRFERLQKTARSRPARHYRRREKRAVKKRFVVLVALVIFVFSCAGMVVTQEKKPESPSAEKKPSVYEEYVVTETLTIDGVDLEKRVVTLERTDGSVFDLTVGPEVTDLPQAKVGDVVTIKYYESIFVKVTEPGPAEGPEVKGTTAREKPGEKPAGMDATQVTVTATVEKIDKKTMTATLKGADGEVVDVKVRDPKHLENVNVGDQVVFTYTEGMAFSVEKPKKK